MMPKKAPFQVLFYVFLTLSYFICPVLKKLRPARQKEIDSSDEDSLRLFLPIKYLDNPPNHAAEELW